MKKVLIIAASLLAIAAVASCNQATEQPDLVTYTLAVEVPDGATKALSLDGKTLNAVWASSDVVTVFNSSNTSIGTLTPQTTGSSGTTLKGTITGSLSTGASLRLLSPKSSWLYSNQDGSFATASSKYAFASATVSVTAINGSTITTGPAAFEHQQALVKFTLVDGGNNPVKPDELTISSASGKIVRSVSNSLSTMTGSLTVLPNDDTNVLYVALRNDSGAADTYSLSAVVGSNTYTATKAGVTFQNGKYYDVTVKMQEVTETFTVAGGPEEVFGSYWNPADENNNMVKQSDGTYKSKTYNITKDPTSIAFKIVKDHDYEVGQWPASDYTLTAGVGPFYIVFDPVTETITPTYTKSTASTIYTVAGTPASVFGQEWNASYAANDMSLQGDGTYAKTFNNVPGGTQMKFKVVVNHSWSTNYGASNSDLSGDSDGNCVYTKSSTGNVTIKFNPTTKRITVQ